MESVENENNEEKIKVHVSGAVNKEGVVELEINSRIVDAIDKAGGIKENACMDEINLAYKLEDGMKVYIPTIDEKKEAEQRNEIGTQNNEYVPIGGGTNNKNENKSPESTKIDINTCTQTELETLPGIGPSTALKIIQYRNEKGIRLMDLAEAVNVTPDHLKRIESANDRNNISLMTLYKISIILGVRIDKFFEE